MELIYVDPELDESLQVVVNQHVARHRCINTHDLAIADTIITSHIQTALDLHMRMKNLKVVCIHGVYRNPPASPSDRLMRVSVMDFITWSKNGKSK